MGGWEIIVKPLNLDASSVLSQRDSVTSVHHPEGLPQTAICNLSLFVISNPMTTRFPIGLALEEKKNITTTLHQRKISAFCPHVVVEYSSKLTTSEQRTHPNIRAESENNPLRWE